MTDRFHEVEPADERVALLRRAADAVPVGPLHTDHLVATAHRRRRQRRARVLAAAAVLVVAGGTAAMGLTRDDPSRPGDDAAVVRPAPIAETRLVGVGRLAVEVPADWPSGKVQCEGPSVSGPTVFSGVGGRDCRASRSARPSTVSSATPRTSPTGRRPWPGRSPRCGPVTTTQTPARLQRR